MKHYLNLDAIPNLETAIEEIIDLKNDPYSLEHLGKNKILGMLFFNPSLKALILHIFKAC